MKIRNILLAATAISAASFSANAKEIRPYIGFDAGGLFASYEHTSTGVAGDSLLEKDFLYASPYVGVEFNKNVALEVGYFHTLEESKSFNGSLIGGTGTVTTDVKYHGFSIDAVGTYDLTDKFGVLGLVGVVFSEGDLTVSSGSITLGATESETAAKGGVGFSYDITNNIIARTKAEYLAIGDGFATYSAGLQYKF